MSKQQTELQQSIDNWIEKRDCTTIGQDGFKHLRFNGNCVLCEINVSGCRTCVVFDSTGRLTCSGTPYITANKAFYALAEHDTPSNRLAWSHAAQAEIDFLRSLQT